MPRGGPLHKPDAQSRRAVREDMPLTRLPTAEERNLRTVIDECFFVERVSENLEEIGNLQRMLSENLAVSWIERTPQMLRLRNG